VIRTRVGYQGGTKLNPTYYDLGDHSETVQLDYDPTVISYEELVRVFFASHDPNLSGTRCQYRSAIFVYDAEQQRVAEQVKAAEEARLGHALQTSIEPAKTFYLAEDYHQKYGLQLDSVVFAEFQAIYPDVKDLVNSTAATRVNAYLYGMGTRAQLERELPSLGLSEESQRRLLDRLQ
jgi:peptide-methionine (S)-S-oxide reductase